MWILNILKARLWAPSKSILKIGVVLAKKHTKKSILTKNRGNWFSRQYT